MMVEAYAIDMQISCSPEEGAFGPHWLNRLIIIIITIHHHHQGCAMVPKDAIRAMGSAAENSFQLGTLSDTIDKT
jgi:hypothetical protein